MPDKKNTKNKYSRTNILKKFISRQFENTPKKKLKRASNNIKWTKLIHNGVKFPKEYVKKDIPLIYDGKEIILDKESEEIAFLYAKYIDTEYVTMATFNRNFFNDWKKIMGKNTEIQSLQLCDFSLMKQYLLNEKEEKKKQKRFRGYRKY